MWRLFWFLVFVLKTYISQDIQISKTASMLFVSLMLIVSMSHTRVLQIIFQICATTTNNGKPNSVAEQMSEGPSLL